MKRALMLSLFLIGCGMPLQVHAVNGGGVSADGDTAWFGVLEGRGDVRMLKVYQCTPDGCAVVPAPEGLAPVRTRVTRRPGHGVRESADPVDSAI